MDHVRQPVLLPVAVRQGGCLKARMHVYRMVCLDDCHCLSAALVKSHTQARTPAAAVLEITAPIRLTTWRGR